MINLHFGGKLVGTEKVKREVKTFHPAEKLINLRELTTQKLQGVPEPVQIHY